MNNLRNLSSLKNILILCLLIIVVPIFFHSGYLLSIFIFIGIHAVIVFGLLLLVGYTGQVSLGHAAFFAIGSYTSAILSTTYKISPWISIIISVILIMVVALIIGFATLKIKGHYLALATLAFGLLVYRLILELQSVTGGAIGLRDIPRLPWGDSVIKSDLTYYFLVWAIVVVVFIFINNITKSPVGLFMKGIDTDETAISVMGINVFYLKLKIFLFSTAMAGLAGALYAHYVTFISPDVFTIDRSILLLMMVVVGGSRYPWGGLIGAVLLTFLPEYLRAYSDLSIGLYGLVMMLIVLYLPGGIASISTIIPGLPRKVKAKNADL